MIILPATAGRAAWRPALDFTVYVHLSLPIGEGSGENERLRVP